MAQMSRRAFSAWVPALSALGFVRSARADRSPVPTDLGISRREPAIHQEIEFNASAARVYAALTEATQFQRLVVFSGAIQSMRLAGAPAQFTAEPGAAFSLFGGYITGRNVELEPGRRIVQAWRTGSWPAHHYSIVSFDLADHADHAGGCRLVFDHRGFPADAAESLARGWQDHYWAPLAKVLA